MRGLTEFCTAATLFAVSSTALIAPSLSPGARAMSGLSSPEFDLSAAAAGLSLSDDGDGQAREEPRSPPSALGGEPTLCVTIGPQCCGKTTSMKELGPVTDVTIDDQAGVYLKVGVEGFVEVSEPSSTLLWPR